MGHTADNTIREVWWGRKVQNRGMACRGRQVGSMLYAGVSGKKHTHIVVTAQQGEGTRLGGWHIPQQAEAGRESQ